MSLLEDVAALAPDQASTTGKAAGTTGNGSHRSRFLLDRYLADNGREHRTKQLPNGTVYLLKQCLFDPSHGGNWETGIFQRDDGLLTYECKHNSCQGRTWHDAKTKIGTPDPQRHYDPPLSGDHKSKAAAEGPAVPLGTILSPDDRNNYGEVIAESAATCTLRFVGKDGTVEKEFPKSSLRYQDGRPVIAATESPTFATSLLSSPDFDSKAYRQEFLIDHVLEAGSPCVGGGRSKTMKTTLIGIDMVVSLGTGTPFLGYFPTKRCRVAFWSGEAGAPTIQGKARRVAESRGMTLSDCSVFWSFSLPKLGRADHVDALAEVIQKHALDVIVVDPLYLSLLEAGENGKPSDLFFMGSKLLPLSELGQATGCTIVLLHHFRKSGNGDGEEVALEELSQSGVAEWARQWVLLARRSPYEHDGRHELWMRCGGSSGHAGMYGVDVDEGTIDEHFDGRKWDVSVQPGHEIIQTSRKDKKAARADQQRSEDEEGQRAVIHAMARLPRGEGVFKARLYELTGIGEKRLGRLLEQLAGQQIVETCAARQSNQKTPKPGAFRLTDHWWTDQ
jgi:hypothetical protein